MSERSTIHVSGIAGSTTDKEVQDFFSFWYDQHVQLIRNSILTYSLVERSPLSLSPQFLVSLVLLSPPR